jgi:hypothetical protein
MDQQLRLLMLTSAPRRADVAKSPCHGQVKRAYVRNGATWTAIGVWCDRCARFWPDLAVAAVEHG